jgi:hypothetical protein
MEAPRVPGESPLTREAPRWEVDDPRLSRGRRRWAYWLLLIPFVALLYPPWYDNRDPELGGVPFFVWYQFVWVVLGSAITYLVYRLTERIWPGRRRERRTDIRAGT